MFKNKKKLLFTIVGGFFGLIIIGLIVLYFSIGSIIKQGVETFAPQVTGTSVTIKSVSLSPLSGNGHITGVVIGNPEGFKTENAFELGKFKIDIDLMSLLSDDIIINEILIDGTKITYEPRFKGSNITAIQKNVETFANSAMPADEETATKEEAKEIPSKKSSKSLLIKKLTISNSTVKIGIIGGAVIPAPLPTIEMTNIGGKGKSIGETVGEVFGSLTNGITEVVSGAAGSIKDAGKSLKKKGKKLLDSLNPF